MNPSNKEAPILDSEPARQFIHMLSTYPQQTREGFKSLSPYEQEPLRKILEAFYDQLSDVSHMPQLIHSALPSVDPDANVLFLATGGGEEVVAARKVFSSGKLIAVDVADFGIVHVCNGLLADADFYQIDLSKSSPKEVFRAIGYKPDIVICRHPDIYRDRWWIDKIPEWALTLESIGSAFMITNFLKPEHLGLNIALWSHGLFGKKLEFMGGPPTRVDPTVRFDSYVTVFDFRE